MLNVWVPNNCDSKYSIMAVLFPVCTDKPLWVNIRAVLESHICLSLLNASEQVKRLMPHPVNVAVSCHARCQILTSFLQHRWWYLSCYLKWGRNAPSRVSSNSLDVVSCPLRVKIAAGHIISVICSSSSQEQLCGSVGMVKVWLDSEATSLTRK